MAPLHILLSMTRLPICIFVVVFSSRTKISGAYWDDERKLKFANGTRKTTVNSELLQYGQRTQDNHSSN